MTKHEFNYNQHKVVMEDGDSVHYANNYARSQFYEDQFLQYIASLGLKGSYIDIGTNIGNHAVHFGKFTAADRVIGFEPITRYFELAKQNVRLNGLEDTVQIRHLALGEEPGHTTIEFGNVRQDAPIETLDTALLEESDVTIIKMDVEGMEPQVLRGALKVLDEQQPRIFLEVIQEEGSTTFNQEEISTFLAQFGYAPTGRVFNYQPTVEFAPIDQRAEPARETIDLRKFNTKSRRLSFRRPSISVASDDHQELEIQADTEERVWVARDLYDFTTCNERPDIHIPAGNRAFIEVEAYASGEAKFWLTVNAYRNGQFIGEDRIYVNRRSFYPIDPKDHPTQLRFFFGVIGRGGVLIRKLAVTQVRP